MESKFKVVFVLGPPGSGKGTQCFKIGKEFGYVHLSAGELLREEMTRPSSHYGALISKHIKNGTIVPVEITCSLLERAMNNYTNKIKESGDIDDCKIGKFLIDGFPRNYDNLQGWEKVMSDKTLINFVLFFDCPQEICIKRCLKRKNEGICRSDDNEESLKKRLVTYANDTLKIIQHYEMLNLVKRIDATPSPDQVYLQVRQLFEL